MRKVMLATFCALILITQHQALAAFNELTPLAEPHSFVVRVVAAEDGGVVRYCSGALVSRWHVLTAAHCVERARQSSVELTSGEQILVTNYLLDEEWRSANNPYALDSALLRLASPVTEWRPLAPWSDTHAADRFWSAGYILRSHEMYAWSGTLDSLVSGVMYQERAGEPGLSGAPLLHGDVIVGVHSHRVGEATAYALVQRELVDMLAADLRDNPAPTPLPQFRQYLPLILAIS